MTYAHRLRAAVAVAALTGLAVLSAPSAATATTPKLDPKNPCGIEGWFVNPDEANRVPELTYDGMVFEDADLIHHNAPPNLTTKTLQPGHYLAFPAPDQPSFFSVEVAGDDGGYATLRYNRVTHLWNMVTGGAFYEHADPDKLVDMPPSPRSHKVVRWGFGYTANPPGTVKTTVRSVSFQGKAYYFKCLKPRPSHSPTPSTTPPTTKSPTSTPSTSTSPSSSGTASPSTTSTSGSPSATASATASTSAPVPTGVPSAGGDGSLPVTGASLGAILTGATIVLLVGLGAVALTRRKKRPVDDPEDTDEQRGTLY